MDTKRNGGKMSNSLSRGIGIGLVVVLSGLLLVGFTSSRHFGFGMMGGSTTRNDSTVCTPPAETVGQRINVSVSDMDMMMGSPRGMQMALGVFPSRIVTGKLNIIVTNMGRRTHELVILPLADGQIAGQRVVSSEGKVDESGSVGEVSNNCGTGVGEGILSGSRGWTSLTLKPGRYEFICNLPNHYSAGMYQEVVVNP